MRHVDRTLVAARSPPADPRPAFPPDAPPAPPQGWGLAELHAHTSASDGVPSPGELVRRADELGLDVLAVTDHDTIDGALRARDIAAATNAGVEVVVGMEVTTRRQDHVVGLFLEHPVPIFRPLVETVEAIQAQGGLAIVAHPFLGVPTSISVQRLLRALAQVRFDGIETENQYFRERTRAAGAPVSGDARRARGRGRGRHRCALRRSGPGAHLVSRPDGGRASRGDSAPAPPCPRAVVCSTNARRCPTTRAINSGVW